MELSKKQQKILKLLSMNCRYSNKDIAKAVGMSKDGVSYQVDKLIKNDELGFFNTQFNASLLGYETYHVWIKTKTLSKQAISNLCEIKEVFSINESYGKFNLQILIYSKSEKEFEKIIKNVEKILKIKEIKSSRLIGHHKMFTNVLPIFDIEVTLPKNKKKFEYEISSTHYLDPKEEKTSQTNKVSEGLGIVSVSEISERLRNKANTISCVSKKNSLIAIDNIDKKIIKAILKSPRGSFQELEKISKINHETIRYRLKKYIKTRFINNFGLIHNFQKYNLYPFYLLLNIENVDEKIIKEKLYELKNVFYSPKLEGDYNTMIYILSENPLDFGKIYSEILNLFENEIEDLELLVLDKIHKYEQFPFKEL